MIATTKYFSLSNEWMAQQIAKAEYVEPKTNEEYDEYGLWDWREENEEDAHVDDLTGADESEFSEEDDDDEKASAPVRVLLSPLQLPVRLQDYSALAPLGDASRPKQKSLSFWCRPAVVAPAAKASKKRTRQRRKRNSERLAPGPILRPEPIEPLPKLEVLVPPPAPAPAPKPRTWIELDTSNLVPINLAHPEQDRLVIEQEREWQIVEARKKAAEAPKPKWCASTRADIPCQKPNCNARHDLRGILEGTNWCNFGDKCRRVAWSAAERRLVNSLRPNQKPCRFKHARETEYSFKRRCFPVLLREEARQMRLNVVGRNDGITLISASPDEFAEVSLAATLIYGRGRFRLLRRIC